MMSALTPLAQRKILPIKPATPDDLAEQGLAKLAALFGPDNDKFNLGEDDERVFLATNPPSEHTPYLRVLRRKDPNGVSYVWGWCLRIDAPPVMAHALASDGAGGFATEGFGGRSYLTALRDHISLVGGAIFERRPARRP